MATCLLCYCRRSTAVSNAYGGRRTIRMTVVNSAADGRRTMNITVKRVYDRGKIE